MVWRDKSFAGTALTTADEGKLNDRKVINQSEDKLLQTHGFAVHVYFDDLKATESNNILLFSHPFNEQGKKSTSHQRPPIELVFCIFEN